jgi:Zn ribbon nucleic-acid-binding protein
MEHVSCPLCGEIEKVFLWEKREARYVRCLNCTLVFEDPRLTGDELKRFYSDESYYINSDNDDHPSGYTRSTSSSFAAAVSKTPGYAFLTSDVVRVV